MSLLFFNNVIDSFLSNYQLVDLEKGFFDKIGQF